MKRRRFLPLSFATYAFAPLGNLRAQLATSNSAAQRKSDLVRSDADSSGQPFQFLDALFYVKVSGRDTDGRCVIFDTLRPKQVGPRLHLHTTCDEWFFVREGEFKFQAGDEMLRLRSGDSLLVPRNVPHAFVKTSQGTARLLIMHQPEARMEEYFRAATKLASQSEEHRALALRYGTHFVGPALKPD